MSESGRVRRLKWLCRRGMKELDVLLQPFVERNKDKLAQGAWPEFEGLLETEDDLLWDWLQHTGCESASRYRDLLDQIRHARS
ncbi:MAG: succinate dehydrogenase assembly factor 2 [Xanthomonadales bacterium]|nr:succinate dehydrogenase assembly factor 2 [Gammaproteobacteria bacterium]MBT8052774.1 succinate dehydrogenase assembly factor 2 [Gammaproteobacteria bacterium]NND56163.1 succinate dehydrogenase assembly factor 2 [Xanthomonadales bacterium]NNK50568.1 succinate dehydrogenase assembly factor 2 [Xanthomonadales bacterium]